MGEHGHARSKFKGSLDRGHYRMAPMLAPEVPNMDLADALRLTLLARSEDPEAFERMALRWAERFITEAEPPLPEVSLALALLADVKAGRRATDDVEKELLSMAVRPQIAVV